MLPVVGRSRIDAVFERYSEIRRHRHGGNGRAQAVIGAVKQDLEQCKFKRSGLGVGEASVARRAKQAYSSYVDAARQGHAQA